MGFEAIPGTDIRYGLISFDADGCERRDDPAGRMREVLIEKARRDRITNIFFFCHGWKGDIAAAKEQYNNWIKAFASSSDVGDASRIFDGFRPLYIGLHWPSLPWGDEELVGGAFGTTARATSHRLLETYLARLGDRPETRSALEAIFDEARRNTAPEKLPPHVRQAYLDLNSALGLSSAGVGAPPDADREPFDPDESFETANEESTSFGSGVNLGGLLGPLRQLSYWSMKKRARTVGEGEMHSFLRDMQMETEPQHTRIHLMGHSFGTIVVSGMLAGPNAQGSLRRAVDSLALIQGAVSLWSYAESIPFLGAGQGYFYSSLKHKKVCGPIIATRSRWDKAVGLFYPLASRLKGSANFVAGLPEYGAIGTYGVQGLPDDIRAETPMISGSAPYHFEDRKVYNLEASQYICHGDGASGAHTDIAGPEVAHAIWAAALGPSVKRTTAGAI